MLYYTPSNPRTPAQQGWRGSFRQAVWGWHALTRAQQLQYNHDAQRFPGWTGFNLYVSEYLKAY